MHMFPYDNVGGHDTRVKREGGDWHVVTLKRRVVIQCRQNVAQLALPVARPHSQRVVSRLPERLVKARAAERPLVSVGRDEHDARRRLSAGQLATARERRKQRVGEADGSDVVDADLSLESVGGQLVVARVDAGVVAQHRHTRGPSIAVNLRRRSAHRAQIGEVEHHDFQASRVCGAQRRSDLVTQRRGQSGRASCRKDQIETSAQHRHSGRNAKAAGCTGHDGGTAAAEFGAVGRFA